MVDGKLRTWRTPGLPDVSVVKTYTAQIFVGLREGYSDTIHKLDVVRDVCRQYVEGSGLCVTITPTEFVYTPSTECPHSGEPGAIVGLISYPRFPSDEKTIRTHAGKIARLMVQRLNQYRVSIVYPDETVMIECKT